MAYDIRRILVKFRSPMSLNNKLYFHKFLCQAKHKYDLWLKITFSLYVHCTFSVLSKTMKFWILTKGESFLKTPLTTNWCFVAVKSRGYNHCFKIIKSAMPIVKLLVTFKRSLIIDDKSLPHKLRRLLIFKIKLSSESPTRWLTGSAAMTPVL